jgi:uncharacterized membrane protein/Mg-chelatase subunit ChlD
MEFLDDDRSRDPMSLSFLYPAALWLLLLLPFTIWLALLGARRPTPLRFWSGLILRSLLLSGLILALAGVQLRLPSDTVTTVFVLDLSDSIPAVERARGEAFIRQAIEAMPKTDEAAVVVFGGDALVERLPSEEPLLAGVTSAPVTSRTNIGEALQLAMALFPNAGARRVVLLSDGRENLGQALDQAELAALHGIELSYAPLSGPEGEVEVLVERLEAPADVRRGQDFDLSVLVQSTAQTEATLRLFADGALLHSQSVRLQPGPNRFRVPYRNADGGFVRFRAQVIPNTDTWLQNNEAGAFTVVHGAPRLLLVEGAPTEGENLARALAAAGMEIAVARPEDLPTTLASLAAFDAILLANVPVTSLPPGSMETLQIYVRDLGKGLFVSGGEQAFGAGGYLRTALEETLPVDMDVRTREQTPNLALALVVDKSGSMGACHCENPDLEQRYDRRAVGLPKVDIAKEAVMQAANALGPQDYLGVVAFDTNAYWAVDMSRLGSLISIENSIGGIQADGGTSISAGLEAAYRSLQGVDARLKHVILMTDGWLREGDLFTLAAQMHGEGITLSVVAAGGGSALYLMGLADHGGGRYYPATDILRVPDFFLKETVQAVGRYIVEEPFFPLFTAASPVMREVNIRELPLLWGYNGTTSKQAAQVVLTTAQGDPLLATWQYGLGRSAIWTSDLKGQWASEWVTWEGFPRFMAQLVGWTLPAPQVEGIDASATVAAGDGVIAVTAADEAGRPRNFLDASAMVIYPDLTAREVKLIQVGPGQYRAGFDASHPGAYLVRLNVAEGETVLGQQTLGMVAPYSPEYRVGSTDYGLLARLAETTGGAQLAEPVAAFARNLPFASQVREIWGALLLAVVLLFPLDVALRRVMLGSREFRKVTGWLGDRLPSRQQTEGSAEPVLGHLFHARERVRGQQPRPADSSIPAPPTAVTPPAQEPRAAEPPQEGDALARLRAAKERARRSR